ncbi:hypothetical protein BH11MYX3_BH11MYX3_15010 [soil metagenome]
MKRAHLAGWILGLATICAVCATAAAQPSEEEGDGTEQKEKKEEGPSTLKTLASYGLAILGLGIGLIPVTKTFSSSYSYAQARLMITNMLRTNPYQAEMMAKKMAGTFCEAIAVALKTGGTTRSQDLAIVSSATKPTYDGIAMAVAARWKADVGKAKLGVMAAGGGAAVGLAGGSWPAIPVIIAVIAVLGFARLLWFNHELGSSIMRGRAEVLPEVDQAIVSGRYVAPLPPG